MIMNEYDKLYQSYTCISQQTPYTLMLVCNIHSPPAQLARSMLNSASTKGYATIDPETLGGGGGRGGPNP